MDVSLEKILQSSEDEIVRLVDVSKICKELSSSKHIENIDGFEYDLNRTNEDQKAKVRRLMGKLVQLSKQDKSIFATLIRVLRDSDTQNHNELADILESMKRDLSLNSVSHKIDQAQSERQDTLQRHGIQLINHDERIKSLESDVEDLKATEDTSTLKEKLDLARRELEALKQEHVNLQKELEEEKVTTETLIQDLQNEKEKAERQAERIEKLEKRIRSLEKTLEEANERNAREISELKRKGETEMAEVKSKLTQIEQMVLSQNKGVAMTASKMTGSMGRASNNSEPVVQTSSVADQRQTAGRGTVRCSPQHQRQTAASAAKACKIVPQNRFQPKFDTDRARAEKK